MAFWDELRHAFAVDADAPAKPTEEQGAVIDRLCRGIVRRRLTTPAILYLEMSRPLGYLAAQAIHFFTPILRSLTDAQGCRHFAEFLERSGAVDYLLKRIEVMEQESAALRAKR